MTKLLTNPWMTLPVGALIYLATMLVFWKTPAPPAATAAAADAVTAVTPEAPFVGPSWEFSNPEADELIVELKKEKDALNLRSQQLDDLSSRLQAESNELAVAAVTLRHMQEDIDSAIVRVKDEEVPNLKRLAKVYADMTPDAAATVLSQLDDAGIVKIMLFMKDSETATILEVITKKGPAEAKRAAALSEHIRLSTTKKGVPVPSK